MNSHHEILFFASFLIFIILILLFDLGVFTKRSNIISFKKAIIWTIIWVSLSLLFFFGIRIYGDLIHGINSSADIEILKSKYDHQIELTGDFETDLRVYKNELSLEYLTGYLIEYSLSLDNVFVILLIFIVFGIREKYYKRVLFWGILGAIVMRFIFIFLASTLIQNFVWVLYLFGGILIFSGVWMFITRNKEKKIEPQRHPVVKFASRYFAVFPRLVGQHFFIRKKLKPNPSKSSPPPSSRLVWTGTPKGSVRKYGKLFITPLFLTLLVVEFSDVVFAIDSVPAIFSVTKDPYIVFFSNIFAIIGLRSLFFLVVNIIKIFHYLKIGLSVLLVFVGFKLIFHHYLKEVGFTTQHSLYIVIGIIVVSIVSSIIFPKKK